MDCNVVAMSLMFFFPYILYYEKLANIAGEISRKTVATSYWRNELHEELHEVGSYNKWIFCEESCELGGIELNALEHLEKLKCEMLYSHKCSPRLQGER